MTHPPILGGQGRTPQDVRDSANVIAFFILVALACTVASVIWRCT